MPANAFSLLLNVSKEGEWLSLSGNETDLAKDKAEAQAPLGVSSPSDGDELHLLSVCPGEAEEPARTNKIHY